MIHHRLGIKNYIKFMNELEKLKRLLFDENQYYLFEHIPKPILSDTAILGINDQNDKDSEFVNGLLTCNAQLWHKKTDSERVKNFKVALKNIKEKKDPNIIDQKLIQILDNLHSLDMS